MPGKADFSFEVPLGQPAGFKPLPELVAFDLCKPYPLPGGNVLLRNTRNGKRALVRPEVYNALVKCNAFRSIADHTARLLDHQPADPKQRQDVRGVLQQMLKAGILCSTREVMDRIKSPVDVHHAADGDTTPVAAIITWERPEALKRLLGSMLKNCRTGGLHCLYVIDDSRSAENRDKNHALVEAFSAKFDTPLHYFGRAEQRALIKAIVNRIPQHEDAVRFLIDTDRWAGQWTSGLARNLATFLSVGRRLIVMDDDIICEVYDPPVQGADITISGRPRENDFFASEEEWSHLRQSVNSDPIDRHLQLLGLTLSEAIAKLGQQNLKASGLENLTSLLASELQADSAVLMTECGSLGCPGTDKNTWLPRLTDTSLRKMLASETRTHNALNHRKAWCGRANPHFSPHANMSQLTGLDNRQMLPPYLPILRGEDALFGCMLDFVFPASVIFDHPWAIPHLPLPERHWQPKDIDFTPKPGFPMFFVDKIVELKSGCTSHSPIGRMASLAGWLRDLAGAPSDTLVAMHIDSALEAGAKNLRHMDELLAAAQSVPVEWQDYLRNGIGQINAGLDVISRGDLPVKGTQGEVEGEALIAFWRETWKGFASACEAWPEIRQAAAYAVGDEPWGA